MFLNVKDIEDLQVLECPAVEQDQDGHHFALRHCEFTVPLPCICFWRRVIPDQVVKFFEKLVNYEINFCNFMTGYNTPRNLYHELSKD